MQCTCFLYVCICFYFKPGAKRVSESFRYGMNSAGREDKKKIKNAQVNSTAVNKFGTKKGRWNRNSTVGTYNADILKVTLSKWTDTNLRLELGILRQTEKHIRFDLAVIFSCLYIWPRYSCFFFLSFYMYSLQAFLFIRFRLQSYFHFFHPALSLFVLSV